MTKYDTDYDRFSDENTEEPIVDSTDEFVDSDNYIDDEYTYEDYDNWDEEDVDEYVEDTEYTRTESRAKPVREATTMSRIILIAVVILSLSPFALHFIVNSVRKSEPDTSRTTEQISMERASVSESKEESKEKESESKEKEKEESESSSQRASSSLRVTTNPLDESSQGESTPTQPERPEQPAPTGGTYTIQAGDSWYAIAQKNGVDLQALLNANGATVETVIHPGDVINLP